MFVASILFAFLMALIFTMIFAVGLRRPGPWSSALVFFLVIFLAAWAGGLWISPAGPVFYGIYWLPIILVAFLFAILLAAVTSAGPPRRTETAEETDIAKQEQEVAKRAFDAFFWILLIALIGIIVLGYLPQGPQA